MDYAILWKKMSFIFPLQFGLRQKCFPRHRGQKYFSYKVHKL